MVRTTERVGWRSVTVRCGEQSVTMDGTASMLVWCAISWDMGDKVCVCVCVFNS